jgi:diguanylate cyclase (GGDEF)-like protein
MQQLINLAYGQNRILELIAVGAPLRESLTELLLFIEKEVPELLCSVLLLDADGLHLRHGAAPNLPQDYCRLIDGAAIGPKAGSCGTAAYRAAQVVVSDIETDPLWEDYRALVKPHGLRACWSTPILGPFGKVLGTFAMYFKEPRMPDDIHERLIGIATHVAAIAIIKELRDRALHESNLRIEHLAYHETVTGLPNRASMQRTLAAAVARAEVEHLEFSLLLLNLNYFRDINDSLGHQNGDLLLRRLAERLSLAAGGAEHVAALGGDEFAVLLRTSSGDRALEPVKECLRHPVDVIGLPIKLEAAIGVAVYPRDGETPELLWQHADVALRTAKERNDAHLYYDASIDPYDPARLTLLGDLRAAIGTDELVLHYQPKIDLKSGRTVGVEALVRWRHPTRGMVSPSTFIPMAERTDLINPLTEWIVDAAITQALAFVRAGMPLEMSVNLSARNLHEPGFCTQLLSSVRAKGFPLTQLTMEITETAIMADPVRAQAGLKELRDAGIQLSMDDFGVGQSSLTYLKDLPISKMKIDKSFVMDFGDPRNTAIVQSAIDLARHMGLAITAEGVEQDVAYRALCDLGCDQGQGMFFSWGLPADALMTWLRDSRWGAAS